MVYLKEVPSYPRFSKYRKITSDRMITIYLLNSLQVKSFQNRESVILQAFLEVVYTKDDILRYYC